MGNGPNAQWAVRQGAWKLLGNSRTVNEGAPLSASDKKLFLANLDEDVSESKNLVSSNPTKVKELLLSLLSGLGQGSSFLNRSIGISTAFTIEDRCYNTASGMSYKPYVAWAVEILIGSDQFSGATKSRRAPPRNNSPWLPLLPKKTNLCLFNRQLERHQIASLNQV